LDDAPAQPSPPPLQEADPAQRYRRFAGALLILLATLICYSPALRGDFIWDDDRHISQNPTLIDADGLRRIWFEWGATPQYYPMTHTSFWIEQQLWGLNTTGYHLTNVLLHSVNAMLLWLLLRRLRIGGAFVIALLFALHPVNVESVAWMTERKNTLGMFFALLSVMEFLKTTRSSYWLALLFFLCALLSKTITASVPAVLLILIWWQQGRVSRRKLLRLAPMFAIGAAMGVMTAYMERTHVNARGEDWPWTMTDRILIAGRAVWFYAGKVVLPRRLTFSYPQWSIDVHDLRQWLYPAGLALVVVALWLLRRRIGRGPLAAVLIYGVTLFPALGFVNTYPMRYSFVADHFQYLSIAAMLTLIVGAVARLRAPAPMWATIGVVLAAICGGLTWKQAHIYKDAETIWRDTLVKNPSSWMARNNLGVVLSYQADADRAAGRDEQANAKLHAALNLFDQTLAIRPQHAEARINRGDALAKLGRYDEALAIFTEQAAKDPSRLNLRDRIAYILEKQGRPQEAVEVYRRFLAANPRSSQAHLRLGQLLIRTHHPADAAPELEQYLSSASRDTATMAALGELYLQLGRWDDARRWFNAALQIDPFSAAAQRGLDALEAQR
jgi:tetratricopeptide (TPR) repeat protein